MESTASNALITCGQCNTCITQESQEKGILEERSKWAKFASEVNITKDSVGYMKPLVSTVIINTFFSVTLTIVDSY